MRLLVVGGTQFVGRALVEAAAAAGHEVTLFHRGRTEPAGLPDVEHVHGDRDGGLGALAGRSFDAAVDTSAYVPRAVRELVAAIGERVGHYTLVSSLSVLPDGTPPGADERSPIHSPPYPATEEITWETYGPLKAACEAEARAGFGDRCLLVRPGYIVGPHDPTDRFTWYLRRVAGGGAVAAPGPPDAPLQVVDVRDLASFMLSRIAAGDGGVYGVVGPGEPLTTAGMLETARDEAGVDAELVWVAPEAVAAADGEAESWFPLWHPDDPGAHAYDGRRAVAAGLRHRPFRETVADTLAWDRGRGLPAMRVGLPPERERELLAGARGGPAEGRR